MSTVASIEALPNHSMQQACDEFWISLASLLRSYTALHGLSGGRQAAIESGNERILASHGGRWLDLRRVGARVQWKREDGQSGAMELTETGRLREESGADEDEAEMDMAAERWARELMR